MTIKILNRDSNTITIAEFYQNLQRKQYNFDPAYQRKSIWTEEKQSFFLDSILKNYPIPPVFLRRHIDSDGNISYDVIDGKQRLLSLKLFIENKLPVVSEEDDDSYDHNLAGKLFSEIKENKLLSIYRDNFWKYSIPVEYIDEEDDKVIRSIFDRLNRNGEPLEGQELRNANYYDKLLHTTIQALSKNTFWSERLKVTEKKRMEDDAFIAELVFLILENKISDSNESILDSLYHKHADLDHNQSADLVAKFNNITGQMQALNLEYDKFRIAGVSHLYGIWTLVWEVSNKGLDINNISANLSRFFELYRDNSRTNDNTAKYKDSMSSRTKSRSQREQRLSALKSATGLDSG